MKMNRNNLIVALIFFLVGYFFQNLFFINNPEKTEDFSLFWDVWTTLEKKYPFEEPDNIEKQYEAIQGLVDAYDDDYSVFFPPEPSKQFLEDVTGHFGGAGMEVALKEGYLVVIAPLKNSPAEKAGFLPGDIITEIENEETYGKTLDELISKIRGEIGTKVKMTIVRFDVKDPVEIMLVRGEVNVPVLDTQTIDDTFVISLYNFNQHSEDNFKEAIQEFKKSKLPYLILDLRNNPGGYLNSSIHILSYFFDQGVVLVKEDFGDSGKKQSIHRSKGFDMLEKHQYEIAILVNFGSASASEIVAGAFQDHKKALIVGQQTYGKGSVQELIDLDDGTSLKVTTARWLTPKDNQISKIGIKPDFLIDNIDTLNNVDVLETTINFLKNKRN